MFIEDVHTQIMPFRSSQSLSAAFEGAERDAGILARICTGLSEHASARDNPLEIVSSAVRRVSQYLALRGQVSFEISSVPDEAEGEVGVSWSRRSVHAITGELLIRMPGRVVGIRTAPRREWERNVPLVVSRPTKTVWCVSVPRVLGGRVGHLRLRSRLNRYPLTMPEWVSQSMLTEHQHVRFDVTSYARLRNAYIARSSGPFGWSGRDASLDHQTEFFLFYNVVTFHHALALLRQHIIASLNKMFEKQLQLNARIALSGFRQPSEILEVRDRMVKGEIGFGQALDMVKF
jgi:hypothetical protein